MTDNRNRFNILWHSEWFYLATSVICGALAAMIYADRLGSGGAEISIWVKFVPVSLIGIGAGFGAFSRSDKKARPWVLLFVVFVLVAVYCDIRITDLNLYCAAGCEDGIAIERDIQNYGIIRSVGMIGALELLAALVWVSAKRRPPTSANTRLSSELPARGLRYVPVGLLLLFVAISMGIIFSAIADSYDFRYHANYARTWYEQGQPSTPLPHVLYHVTLIGLKILLPASSFSQLTVIVMVIANVLTAGILYFYLLGAFEAHERRAHWLTAGLTLILVLVAPITIFTWVNRNLYLGYLLPNIFHNPTTIFVKPMTLALFWIASHALTGKSGPRWVWVVAVSVSVLMPIGKPNYTVALIPGLALLMIFRLAGREPIALKLLIFGIMVPSLLILLYQFLFFSGEAQLFFSPFTAFAEWDLTIGDLMRGTLLSLLYPLMVAALFPRQVMRSTSLQLVWAVMFISIFQMFTLVEGRDENALNWTWGAFLNTFILFAATTRFLVEERRQIADSGWRTAFVNTALVAHLNCGIVWFFFH